MVFPFCERLGTYLFYFSIPQDGCFSFPAWIGVTHNLKSAFLPPEKKFKKRLIVPGIFTRQVNHPEVYAIAVRLSLKSSFSEVFSTAECSINGSAGVILAQLHHLLSLLAEAKNKRSVSSAFRTHATCVHELARLQVCTILWHDASRDIWPDGTNGAAQRQFGPCVRHTGGQRGSADLNRVSCFTQRTWRNVFMSLREGVC